MYRVKRAIIMAAGIGTRMQPITFDTPKPMISVCGIRMIDTVIQGLKSNGINEINIVVGHLKDQFNILKEEYDGINIIENPFYKTCNNISSLYVAKDYLEDAMILDGDLVIHNNRIFNPIFEKSGYNAIWTNTDTDEWLMNVENNKVISCSRTGGKNGWQLYSISRWSAEDGKKLRKHLIEEFDVNLNRQIYWDDVVMFCHLNEYDLGIYPMNIGDVIEIDSFSELINIDSSYLRYQRKKEND